MMKNRALHIDFVDLDRPVYITRTKKRGTTFCASFKHRTMDIYCNADRTWYFDAEDGGTFIHPDRIYHYLSGKATFKHFMRN